MTQGIRLHCRQIAGRGCCGDAGGGFRLTGQYPLRYQRGVAGRCRRPFSHRGRWAFGSIEKGSTTEFIEFIVKDLIEELHNEFSDLEDWSLCDIPFLEESLDGRPYVIYVLTGKSIPTLEVEPLEDWNAEDALYVDADEEDFRCNPQFHITEPRTKLLDALTAYREHSKVQRLSYLLED